MKTLLVFLISTVALLAPAQVNPTVCIDLKDARLQAAPYYTNRTVWVNAMNVPNAQSHSVILGATAYLSTDTNGVCYYSNALPYLYLVTVRASQYGGNQEQFKFLITNNTSGLVYAADVLAASSSATFPAGSVAWAAAVTDARYARVGTTGVGVAAGTNVTMQTNGNLVTISASSAPGAFTAAGTNVTAQTNGNLVTINADVGYNLANATNLPLTALQQGGSPVGYVLGWSGTQWAPTAPAQGGTNGPVSIGGTNTSTIYGAQTNTINADVGHAEVAQTGTNVLNAVSSGFVFTNGTMYFTDPLGDFWEVANGSWSNITHSVNALSLLGGSIPQTIVQGTLFVTKSPNSSSTPFTVDGGGTFITDIARFKTNGVIVGTIDRNGVYNGSAAGLTNYPQNSSTKDGIVPAAGVAHANQFWSADGAGNPGWHTIAPSSPTFDLIGTGTNTSSVMGVGSGAVLEPAGSGQIISTFAQSANANTIVGGGTGGQLAQNTIATNAPFDGAFPQVSGNTFKYTRDASALTNLTDGYNITNLSYDQIAEKSVSVVRFFPAGVARQAPMLTATNINGHGWSDVGDYIQNGLQWCLTNGIGINTLYFPPGIYRVAARTNILVPAGVSMAGAGFLHGGVQNTYDQVTTNYSMLWFDNTASVGLVFKDLARDVSTLRNMEICGYTNPVAQGVEMVSAPDANLARVGLSCVDTNQSWNGWFKADHVSVCGFRVGINNQSAQTDFKFTFFPYNNIGFLCLGTDPTNYLRGILTNNVGTSNIYSAAIAFVPKYGPSYVLADSFVVRNSGGGLRDKGMPYFISGARNGSIKNDSGGASYRYLYVDNAELQVQDLYYEIYNSYSSYLPTTTNPIIAINNAKLILDNVSIGITASTTNIWGEMMTNFVWIDAGANSGFGPASITLHQTSLGGQISPGFDANGNGKLIELYYGYRTDFINDGQTGWIWHSDPNNRNFDFYSVSTKNGHYSESGQSQINDMAQQSPAAVTNYLGFPLQQPYGRLTFQHANPDYFGAVVRSNSVGDQMVGGSPQLVPYGGTNGSLYWVRMWQSDPQTTPIFYPGRNDYEVPENYTADKVTIRTNLTVNPGGTISGSGAGVSNVLSAQWSTNLANGGKFLSSVFTGNSLNGGNAIRIGGGNGFFTLSDTNTPDPLITWNGDLQLTTPAGGDPGRILATGGGQLGQAESSGLSYYYSDGTWRTTNSTSHQSIVYTNGALTIYGGTNLTAVSNLLAQGWAQLNGAVTNTSWGAGVLESDANGKVSPFAFLSPLLMGTNVQLIAGANVTITTNFSGGVLSYTIASTGGSGSSTWPVITNNESLSWTSAAPITVSSGGAGLVTLLDPNTNVFLQLGQSTNNYSLVGTNKITGSQRTWTTNFHMFARDQYGTTNQSGTNGLFGMWGTNGSYTFWTNGDTSISGNFNLNSNLFGNGGMVTNFKSLSLRDTFLGTANSDFTFGGTGSYPLWTFYANSPTMTNYGGVWQMFNNSTALTGYKQPATPGSFAIYNPLVLQVWTFRTNGSLTSLWFDSKTNSSEHFIGDGSQITNASGVPLSYAMQSGSLALTNLSNGNGAGLTNLNAGSLTGGVCIVQWEAGGIRPGDTATAITIPTWSTNTPGTTTTAIQSAGPSFTGWQLSTTGTNAVLGQVTIPFNYASGGTINAEVTVYSGTNYSTKVTNVWAFAASTAGSALGTAVVVTNNLPITTGVCQTNFQASAITIGGTPKPGMTMLISAQSWGGSPYWSSTNTEVLTEMKIWFPVTNAMQSTLTIP